MKVGNMKNTQLVIEIDSTDIILGSLSNGGKVRVFRSTLGNKLNTALENYATHAYAKGHGYKKIDLVTRALAKDWYTIPSFEADGVTKINTLSALVHEKYEQIGTRPIMTENAKQLKKLYPNLSDLELTRLDNKYSA